MSATEYTLYFAWVPQGTPWDPTLARFDEDLFALDLSHDEGQIPDVVVEIKNPRVGLISPSRSYWAWISYSYDACGPLPLIGGRLVGIPEDITPNTIKMKFISRAADYVYQIQQVARSLKRLPNYDKLFFEVAKRDDPNGILEGWSARYHVDRVNMRASASDILVGEDGTVHFAPRDVFYDGFNFRILQSPLAAVNVKMDVLWEQKYRGAFQVGQWAWPTLGADAFVGDWPKSGSALGGGWFAGVSWAGERDPSIEAEALLTRQPQVSSISYTWTNTEKKHRTGDTMSISLNYTQPFGKTIILRQTNQIGLIDPNAVDGAGDPAPVNRPARVSIDYFCYRTFALNFLGKQSLATLSLVYAADRKRSERLEMTIQADVQPVLIDPTVVEDTEQITLKSGDLSLPLIDMENWDSVGMGGSVAQGLIIFPDNPLVPGQTSSQIALNSGTTGMVQPKFSNISGQTTVDGTVTWVSLGQTPPPEISQDWVRLARVALGTLLLPKPVSGVPNIASVRIPGQLNYPPTGTAVPLFSVFSAGTGGPGDQMYECNSAGLLGGLGPQASFHNFRNPNGAFLYIAIQSGTTGEFHTTFPETPGSQVTDGSVIWQCVGPVTLPIGGTPGMTPAASYFPTDRGKLSLLHGFCRARAKLRKRARAVEITFDTRFEVAAQLSCRMNGSIEDDRLPGGRAFGKVISYKLRANADTGVFVGTVVLGCAIGRRLISPDLPSSPPLSLTDAGVPSYVAEGYVKRGYQRYYSSVSGAAAGTLPQQGVSASGVATPPSWPHVPPTVPPSTRPPLHSVWAPGPTESDGDEIGYTPPISEPNDDGVTFPVHPTDVTLKQAWHGLASTINPLNLEIYQLQLDQVVHDAVAQANATKQLNFPAVGGTASGSISVPVSPFYDIQVAVELAVLRSMLQGTGLWYELVLKPLTNGPFANYYVIDTTPLQIPMTVDLSAPS